MKYFALALFATIAASAAIEAEETVIFEDQDVIFSGVTLGTTDAYTSWISSGSGADASITPYFYAKVVQDPGYVSRDTLTGSDCKWQFAFAADDSTANTEVGTLQFSGAATNIIDYTYGIWPVTIADAKGIDESSGATDSGVYRYYLNTGGASFTAIDGSIPPGSAYWTPNCNDSEGLCYYSGAIADGDYAFGVGFKRTNAGVAGIAAGASVSGSFYLSYNTNETFYQAGQMSWNAAPVVEDDTEDDDDSTDTTGDDDTGDDDSQDDGASMLTYGAALAASVYALAF